MRWSARVVLGWVAAGLVACEAPTPSGTCGGFVCAEGERCDEGTRTCVPDQAPVVTVNAPTEVVTSESFTVTGTVRDDVEVKTATWAVDGVSRALELDAEGSFSLTLSAPPVDEKGFNLVVAASDGTRSTNASAIFRVDRVGPVIALVSPDAGVTVTGETTEVQLRVTDASQSLRSVLVDGVALAAPTHDQVLTASVSLPTASNGADVVVNVDATDGHGNLSTSQFTLRADRVGPSLTLTAPTSTEVLNAATFRVRGTATDPTQPVVVRVTQFDGGVVSTTAASDGGAWEAELEIPQVESTLTLRVEAADAVGNVVELTPDVHVDRVAPTVSITSPAGDSLHRQAFTVTADTAGNASSVTARLGSGTPVTLSGGPTTWSGQVPVPAQDYGPLTLELRAADDAGNSTTVQRQVLVDTVAPVVTFTAPAAGRRFNIVDFAATNDVAVSWQVQDADPTATVTQVNGAASSVTQLLVTTSASDNGRVVTTSVSAADQAGNTGSSSLSFSVDRVAPTVTSWTPATGTRNLDQRLTSLTFSEPVFGTTTSTDALVLSPAPSIPGSWSTAHTTWTSATLTPYTVYDANLATLADDHGNPVAAGSARRFHTSALAASTGTATPLATGVSEFRVVSDADGVATVAYRTTASAGSGQTTFAVRRISPQTMTLEAELSTSTLNVTSYGLNAWSVVNGSTLVARNIAAYSWTTPMATGPSPLTQQRRVESGAPTSIPFAIGSAAALSVLPYGREADQSEFGHVEGTSFTRGGSSVTLPVSVNHHVAQSSDSWAGFQLDASALRWTRFRCNRYAAPAPGSYVCEGFSYGAPTSGTPSQLSMAMNRGGSCLIASWVESGQRKALAQSLPNCDGIPLSQCPSNTNLASSTQADGFSVAPYSVGTANSLLAAYQVGFTVQLGTLADPATCNLSFTNLGAALSGAMPVAWAPVQLGQKAALFYLDSSGALRVYVP